MTKQMRALVLEQPASDFKLTTRDMPVPIRNEGQLLVKVEYVGLNPVDSKLAKSGFPSWQYPHIPGLDAVGTVVESNTCCSPSIGDRVMWHADLSQQGGLAEYALVPCYAASIVPNDIPAQVAATLPCPAMTAALAICRLGVTEGDSLLVEAGAGAVGQFAIQFAKEKGALIFATASKQHHSYLKKLGAEEVFDYKAKDVDNKLKLAVGHTGLDAVIDSVGGNTTIRDIGLLRFGGSIACLNDLPSLDNGLLFSQSPSIHVISLGGGWLSNDLCAQQNMSFVGNLVLEKLQQQKLVTPEVLDIPFDAEAVTEAMHRQLAGGLFGKQVVKAA